MLRKHGFFLMIVEDLNVVRVPISECEYDPILVVDADRMKSLEVPAQLFQSVVRWHPKVFALGCRQSIASGAAVTVGPCATQLRIAWVEGSNSLARSSGLRPERTSSTSR